MNRRTILYAAPAVVALLLLAACQSTSAPTEMKEVASAIAGAMKITIESPSGELAQGKNQFRMKFQTADGKPADPGTVTVSSSMSMPGMAPMVAPIELSPIATGEYKLDGTFDMSGAWVFDVRWNSPAGQGSSTIHLSVR